MIHLCREREEFAGKKVQHRGRFKLIMELYAIDGIGLIVSELLGNG